MQDLLCIALAFGSEKIGGICRPPLLFSVLVLVPVEERNGSSALAPPTPTKCPSRPAVARSRRAEVLASNRENRRNESFQTMALFNILAPDGTKSKDEIHVVNDQWLDSSSPDCLGSVPTGSGFSRTL